MCSYEINDVSGTGKRLVVTLNGSHCSIYTIVLKSFYHLFAYILRFHSLMVAITLWHRDASNCIGKLTAQFFN